MSQIASLIDDKAKQALAAVAAKAVADEPAKTVRRPMHHVRCQCVDCKIADDHGIPRQPSAERLASFVVTKRSTDPNPPRKLTQADAIVIDPESEARIEAKCVDCPTVVMVEPRVPEGIDPTEPRIPICVDCARIRLRWDAVSHQDIKNSLHYRTQPVQPKENDMDLSNMSDASLGALVKDQIRASQATEIKERSKKVKAKRTKAEKQFKADRKKAQDERKVQSYEGFMVGTTLEVPTMNLTNVSSLDEMPSAAERSVYNKARFRLTQESPLDPETTTYRDLVNEHERIKTIESERVASQPKAEKPKKAETVQVVAVLDPDEKAKVKALVKTLGITKKQAKRLVGTMSPVANDKKGSR